MTVDTKTYTADELLAMPKLPRYELVEGELRPMSPTGADHSAIAVLIGGSMSAHTRQHRLGGRVYGADCGFRISRNPDTVLAPDAAYVVEARVVQTEKYFPGPPDVAVEVISPNDSYSEVKEKKDRYLAAGTRAVVIVDPRHENAEVWRASGVTTIADALTLDELPGWSLSLEDLFTAVR